MRTILYLTAIGLVLLPSAARGQEIYDAVKAGDVAKVKQLLAANPELAKAGAGIRTPLHDAAQRGQDEIVLLLLAQGVAVDEPKCDQGTALHLAVWKGHKRTAGLLLSKGANVNAADFPEGYTALHIAAREGHLALVELLLCHGANINAVSNDGTPLEIAIDKHHTKIAEMLRRAGARE